MIIVTDCISERLDEGCVKLANELAGHLKKLDTLTAVLACGSAAAPRNADVCIPANRLFLSAGLFRYLRTRREPVLYIPFSSNTPAAVFRTWMLSVYSRRRLTVLFAMRYPMSRLTGLLLKLSGARVAVLSAESAAYFRQQGVETLYLKTGVDTARFVPVDPERKRQLREKYGLPQDEKILLHVGHMKKSRNVEALLWLTEEAHAVLVCSTRTVPEPELRAALESSPAVSVIDRYVEHIEEIYQLADIYLFPVTQLHNCIDVPLSALEAAACGLPVIATAYGELKALHGKEGFYLLESCDEKTAKQAFAKVCAAQGCGGREAVLEYDWSRAAQTLFSAMRD